MPDFIHLEYRNGKPLTGSFPFLFIYMLFRTVRVVFPLTERSSSCVVLFIVNQAVFKGIDNLGIPVVIPLRNVRTIIPLNMAMDKESWLPPVYELRKAGKPSVRECIEVVDVPRRRMSQQDIKTMIPVDFKP